jgi:hypothetical protein
MPASVRWKCERGPLPFGNKSARVFCAGDVRHNSIKRFSSGVRRQHGALEENVKRGLMPVWTT